MVIKIDVDQSANPPRVFIQQQDRLKHFPDEALTFLNESHDRFLMVAGNRTVLIQENLFHDPTAYSEVFGPKKGTELFDNGYAGITSIYRIPNTNRILGFYHAEDWHDRPKRGDIHLGIWSIGMAVSENDCHSFDHRQLLMTSSIARNGATDKDHQGIGDVHVIENYEQNKLYAYFTDLTDRTNLRDFGPATISLATCLVADVEKPDSWRKHPDQAAKGGVEISIHSAGGALFDFIAPFVLKIFNRYLMVFSQIDSVSQNDGNVGKSGIYYSESENGIDNWSEPVNLVSSFPIPTEGKPYKGHPSVFIPKEGLGKYECNGWLMFGYAEAYGVDGIYHQLAGYPMKISIKEEWRSKLI